MRTSSGTDWQHITLGAAYFDDATRVRAGDLDFGLGGLHRAQRLVEFDLVADADVPARHRDVFQALAEVGDHGSTLMRSSLMVAPATRSTQSSSRSGPGSHSFSSRAGGYGVSNPQARNTGASSS